MMPAKAAWYRRRWFKITIISLITMIILAAGIVGVLFVKWNASSEKALFDASEYALKTPGTYQLTTTTAQMKVDVNGQQSKATGTINGSQFDAVIANNTLYIKSPTIEKLYDMFLAASIPKAVAPQVAKILPGLKDRWIRISVESLPANSQFFTSLRCVLDGKDILSADSKSRQQVAGAYLKHPFLDIKSSSDSVDTTTYQLSVDDKKFGTFYESFTKTGFYQSVTICAQANRFLKDKDLKDAIAIVTISQASHQLKSLVINQSGSTVELAADYGSVPKITVPTDTVNYDQISNDIIRSYLQPFLSGR